MENQIQIPDTQSEQSQLPTVVERVNAIQIASNDDYSMSVDFGKSIKKIIDQIEAKYKEPKELANKAHKSICAMEKELLDPFNQAISMLRSKCGTWKMEQERIERERVRIEREKADAEAKALQEKEQKRMEEDRLAQAVELEKLGYKEEADAVMEAPVNVAPVAAKVIPIQNEIPKIKGAVARKKYSYEIVDANLIPRQYLIPNEKLLANQARTLGPDFICPGIRIVESCNVSFSGK